jgi:hypothetical protein
VFWNTWRKDSTKLEQKTNLLICVNEVFPVESSGYKFVVYSLFQMIHVPVFFKGEGGERCFLGRNGSERGEAASDASTRPLSIFSGTLEHIYFYSILTTTTTT